jgi:hypothetical protein
MPLLTKIGAIVLLFSASSSFLQNASAAVAFSGGNGGADPYQSVFIANDRLKVPAPTHKLTQAQPNELPVNIEGGRVRSVLVTWSPYSKDGVTLLPSGSSEDVTVLQHPDGTSYVNITPERIGKSKINVHAFFDDGGFASQEVIVEIQPSDRLAQKLVVTAGGGDGVTHASPLYMTPDSPIGLTSRVTYTPDGKLFAIDPELASFEVISTPSQDSAITLNPITGLVRPNRYGHALVVTRFGGLLRLTCVVVAPQSGDGTHPDCHELRPPELQNEPTTVEPGPGPVISPRPKEATTKK